MSDSLSWIDDDDDERIKELLRRSTAVIAAAHHDLEEQHVTAHGQLQADLPKHELPSQPATKRHVTSAQRRARLRQLLRDPNPDNCAAASHEAVEILCADRHRKHRNKEAAPAKSGPNRSPSTLINFPLRLDYLTNVVIGVLATTLVVSLFVRAGQPDLYRDPLPMVANAKTSAGLPAVLLESKAWLPLANGFHILPRAFPEPLPAFAKDISGLLFLADPLPASAPGISVLPYTGLPRALPAFPEDVARLIGIASPERETSELHIQ